MGNQGLHRTKQKRKQSILGRPGATEVFGLWWDGFFFLGDLKYSIIGGTGHQFFSVDGESGTVTLVNLHKFGGGGGSETSSQQPPTYLLNVSVSDGVYANHAAVRVILDSANVHPPVFAESLYEVNFAENQAAGVLVATVAASDADR